MASESSLWRLLKAHSPLPYMKRIENKLETGTPDVHFLDSKGRGGWIELKDEPDPPKRDTTLTDLGFRQDQYLWLRSYERAGGKAFLFVRVKETFILVKVGRIMRRKNTLPEWLSMAEGVWEKRIDWTHFGNILEGP